MDAQSLIAQSKLPPHRLQELFGLSLHTWCKLAKGRPPFRRATFRAVDALQQWVNKNLPQPPQPKPKPKPKHPRTDPVQQWVYGQNLDQAQPPPRTAPKMHYCPHCGQKL